MIPPSCPKTSEITERQNQKEVPSKSSRKSNVAASEDLAYVINSKRMV